MTSLEDTDRQIEEAPPVKDAAEQPRAHRARTIDQAVRWFRQPSILLLLLLIVLVVALQIWLLF